MKKWYLTLVFGISYYMLFSMTSFGTFGNERCNEHNLNFTNSIIEETTNHSRWMADTQVINMPYDSLVHAKIADCDDVVLFQNRSEHLYEDEEAHRDTLTLCGPDATKGVFLTFTLFELADGDTLFVYDADSVQAGRQVAAWSGVGVGVTGGWIRSECNPSGCLTFEFVTNGDNRKGKGWEAWVTCEDKEELTINCPDIESIKLDCDHPYGLVTINPPAPFYICGELVDSFCLEVVSGDDVAVMDTCIQSPATFTDTFGIGTYIAIWTTKNYPEWQCEKPFSVQGPGLVCNDRIYAPLGSACALDLTPDMLLESPCDTIPDTLYYRIEVNLGSGKNAKKIVGGGGPGIPYPTLERDTLLKYGADNVCGTLLDVSITQVYYEHLPVHSIGAGRVVEKTCTTQVELADQTPPIFINYNRIDTMAACDTASIRRALGTPRILDNCDVSEVWLERIEVVGGGASPCKSGRVVVEWQAVDYCGNIGRLIDTIRVIRPQVNYHPGLTVLNCHENRDYTEAAHPGVITGRVENGVVIPMDTFPLSTERYICGYILLKNDQQFPSSCGEKWIRDWKILDWCDSDTGPIKIPAQSVLISDTIAPEFVNCPDSFAYSGIMNPAYIDLGPYDCALDKLPLSAGIPQAIDNCDPNPLVTMFSIAQLEDGAYWELGRNFAEAGPLECDTFRIGWIAEDHCPEQHKQDTCYRYFIINDNTRPSAICADQLNYSPGNSERILHVDDVDAGSYDACGISNREISLDQIHWDTVVLLTCEAIDEEDPKVYLRVTDLKGNHNTCWTDIHIKDDLPPACGDLPDISEYCDEFKSGALGISTDANGNGDFDEEEYVDLVGTELADFNEKYGNPAEVCEDNVTCLSLQIEQQYQLVDFPCGQTQILRRYRAIDSRGGTSAWRTQLIQLKYRASWTLTFPEDWEGQCRESFPEPSIDIQNGACDQLAWEHEDKVFTIVEDACYKIERTYHVINWCIYKAGERPLKLGRIEDDHGLVHNSFTISSDSLANVGYFTYIQVLKVHSNDVPQLSINDVETCLQGSADNSCAEERTFTVEADACVDFAVLNAEWCIFENGVQVDSGVGNKFNYLVEPGVVYTVQFKLSDGCGNTGSTTRDFEFFDCKNPSPYCTVGLRVQLDETGTITVWSTDFENGSFDNCTPDSLLRKFLWHKSLGIPPSGLEQILDLPTNITFDCDYIGPQEVRVYILDESDNWSFCTTSVDVQDNNSVCSPVDTTARVSGRIQTAQNLLLDRVTVTATDENGNRIATVTNNGDFQLAISKNKTYTLTPTLNTNPLNGVTTFDLVLISKHILGIQPFNDPFQHIAADANQSGTISAFDLVQIRKLILAIDQEFPNNTSWKFVDASYEFEDNQPQAAAYPESVTLKNPTDEATINFTAIKVGDVNHSAAFDGSNAAQPRGVTLITVADRELEAGATYQVDFELPSNYSLEGYQFTLDFGELELIEMKEATAKKHNFGFNLQKRGLLTTSWNSSDATTAASDVRLFSLVVKANQSGKLSEQLAIHSAVTAAEAYDEAGNITNVQLQFKATDTSEDVLLYQNRPNPFNGTTTIGFYLPEAGAADLTITNLQGKILHRIFGDYQSGYQEILIQQEDLPESGVLYYQLTTDKKQVVKRMVVLK